MLEDVISAGRKLPSVQSVAVNDFAAIAEAAVQAQLRSTLQLLELTPAMLLSPQQVAVLLHAAIRSYAAGTHSQYAALKLAKQLCELPGASDIDVDTAASLLLEAARLGCGLLPELRQGLPVAQLLPADTVQQLRELGAGARCGR
jgi:hypothetical protein